MRNSKYAVCYIGYKLRPFSEKCIASISKNKKFDTYAYIDNCGDENEIDKVKYQFLKYFPNANIVIRHINYGPDLNIICAMNETFSKGYDGIFYCENDIYFVDTAFETLENLAEWAKTNVPEASVFHSWNYNLKKEEFQKQYDFYFHNHGLEKLNYNDFCTFEENEVGFTGQNHWGALITRKAWNAIAPYILRHYQSYINAHEISMKAFDFENFMELMSKLQYVDNISNEFKYRTVSRFNLIGWECIYELALLSNGLLRLCLTNPRSMSCGFEGCTSKDTFSEMGLDKIRLNSFKDVPKEFILNQKSKELFLKSEK